MKRAPPPARRRRKIFRGILRAFLTKITIFGETETRTPLNSGDSEEAKRAPPNSGDLEEAKRAPPKIGHLRGS